MSKYVDADKLVAHLKDELEGCKKPVGGRAFGGSIAYGTALGLTMAISFAETLPTADVVEVVRCKDCIHARNMPLGLCYLHTEPYDNAKGYKGDAVCVDADDFCSFGERSKK